MQIEIFVRAFEVERDGEVVRYPDSHLKGIFTVEKHSTDEKEDKLKWCFAMPGEPRPNDFSVVSGSNHKLIELVRFNEAEAIKIIRTSNGHAHQHHEGWTDSIAMETPSENALAVLKDLKRLKSLTLGVANEDVVDHLSGHPKLEFLRFNCEAPAEVISKLTSTLPSLKRLEFSCSKFNATYGKAIANSKSLETLFLPRKNFDEGKEHLEALSKLDVRVRSDAVKRSIGFGGSGVGGSF